MKKAAVVYWSGTGNTEAMANAVVEGVKKGGADVELFRVDQFGADKMDGFDGFLFGCPAMGDEVLEEDDGGGEEAFRRSGRSFRLVRLGRRRLDGVLG